MSDHWQFSLTLWGIHEIVFFVMWGGYAVLHRFDIAPRFRVMRGKAPKPAVYRRSVAELLLSHVTFLPVVVWGVVPAWRWMGGTFDGPDPTMFEIAWQVLACILIQDTLFYWSHRALHTRRLFRAVHGKHHHFRNVRGVAAEYAHPLETLANLVSLVAGPILLSVHPLTFSIWMAIRVWETVEAHSGYAFTTLASRHAYHHLYAARGCLGSFFGLWDRLMGTDAHWKEWREQQPHR